MVSGPEDAALDWRQIDWRRAEGRTAVAATDLHGIEAGDLARVRRLQKLMLRSRDNTLVSVRRVTERNAGRLTAGVDGEVVLTPEAKDSWSKGAAIPRTVQGDGGQTGVHPEKGQQQA